MEEKEMEFTSNQEREWLGSTDDTWKNIDDLAQETDGMEETDIPVRSAIFDQTDDLDNLDDLDDLDDLDNLDDLDDLDDLGDLGVMEDDMPQQDEVIFATAEDKRPKAPVNPRPSREKTIALPFGLPTIPLRTAMIGAAAAIGVIVLISVIGAVSCHRSTPAMSEDVKDSSAANHLTVPMADNDYELKFIDTSNIQFGENVTVEGVDLAGKTLSQAFDAMQDQLKEIRDPISITVNCDKDSITLTQDDFKFNTDVTNVLLQAYHYSRGELENPTVVTSSENGKTDFKVTSILDANSINSAVQKAAKQFDIQPQDAHVKKFTPDSGEKFTYEDGKDGYLVDQGLIKENIQQIVNTDDKTGTFSIKKIKTPYKVTLEQIKANTRLIASHRTTVNNRWESNANMELAVRAASGTVVKPGETFSFNTMTGDTTVGDEHHYPNGTVGSYVKSTAIYRGEHIDQYGGGICQASTTIYNCALKADMEVIERHAHQYPSFYSPFGLDATVDYGNLDMCFKNNKQFPIYIATYVYDSNGDGLNELNVEMYGPVSKEYDEIVPIGWVTSAGPEVYSAKGAKVYFKNGEEIKREYLPEGSYDYYSDGFYDVTSQGYAESLVADDPVTGPAAEPTYAPPAIYSPYGCGDNGPIAYGTEDEFLASIS